MTPVSQLLLVFNESNLAFLRREPGGAFGPTHLAVAGGDSVADSIASLGALGLDGNPAHVATSADGGELWFALSALDKPPPDGDWRLLSIEEMTAAAAIGNLEPTLAAVLPLVREHAIRIPYLNHAETDFIFRFRTEKQRNRDVYRSDPRAQGLYQSALCEVIKRLRRTKERSADEPAVLDFGAVQYVLPSHFGFCLGVQNAIERAYETIATNPGGRVFMLSELIHNPFVNDDLRARGLRYLQSDKGVAAVEHTTGARLWDELRKGDIVIIPAFGATDEDKRRLIEKGIAVNRHDATCMLVEKVWKAARRYGRLGFTVIIHGKHEHEETKATFSNTVKHGPALILRDPAEAERLGEVILAPSPEEARRRFVAFAGKHSAGFDPVRDLQRLAVVNQTTLLRNETLHIIDLLERVLARRFGEGSVREHLFAESRGDTLCYATQVNQDALERALALDLDAAVVVGGKNSSNTFQLFRMCEARFHERAFYIQSEQDIVSAAEIRHFIYPYNPRDPRQGRHVQRKFLGERKPVRLLVTGGASCPDGLIQQIVARINGFFPAAEIRPMEDVLADFESDAVKGNAAGPD
ncbi:MAG TPA: 4-hydroxy-3-methylbut-2-enyl diphosphate reductase [Opitutaceae bacterium]|nr:4-hydroxy-3-methylbut-2-enyl diphosphate reductase [Opitutaceae bacterium]